MRSSTLAFVLALASCSSLAPPLDASHPASPDAIAAPPHAPLRALALEPSELPLAGDSTSQPKDSHGGHHAH